MRIVTYFRCDAQRFDDLERMESARQALEGWDDELGDGVRGDLYPAMIVDHDDMS